jgi:hypothetical protein
MVEDALDGVRWNRDCDTTGGPPPGPWRGWAGRCDDAPVLNPPYPADLIPDTSAGLLAFNAARDEATWAGHVAVSVQLQRGRWTVKLDTLTAPDHSVRADDVRVLAEAVQALVRAWGRNVRHYRPGAVQP